MKRTNDNAFFGAIIFIIVAGCFIYSWKFIIPSYEADKKDIASLDNEIKSAKTKLESLKVAESSINQLGDVVDKVLLAVPSDNDTPNLITELEAVAKKSNILIPGIQISNSSSASTAASTIASTSSSNEVSISFSVNGKFEDLSSFISSIETDLRYMNVISYTLSSGGEDNSLMSLAVQLKAYRRTNNSLTANSASANASTVSASEEN